MLKTAEKQANPVEDEHVNEGGEEDEEGEESENPTPETGVPTPGTLPPASKDEGNDDELLRDLRNPDSKKDDDLDDDEGEDEPKFYLSDGKLVLEAIPPGVLYSRSDRATVPAKLSLTLPASAPDLSEEPQLQAFLKSVEDQGTFATWQTTPAKDLDTVEKCLARVPALVVMGKPAALDGPMGAVAAGPGKVLLEKLDGRLRRTVELLAGSTKAVDACIAGCRVSQPLVAAQADYLAWLSREGVRAAVQELSQLRRELYLGSVDRLLCPPLLSTNRRARVVSGGILDTLVSMVPKNTQAPHGATERALKNTREETGKEETDQETERAHAPNHTAPVPTLEKSQKLEGTENKKTPPKTAQLETMRPQTAPPETTPRRMAPPEMTPTEKPPDKKEVASQIQIRTSDQVRRPSLPSPPHDFPIPEIFRKLLGNHEEGRTRELGQRQRTWEYDEERNPRKRTVSPGKGGEYVETFPKIDRSKKQPELANPDDDKTREQKPRENSRDTEENIPPTLEESGEMEVESQGMPPQTLPATRGQFFLGSQPPGHAGAGEKCDAPCLSTERPVGRETETPLPRMDTALPTTGGARVGSGSSDPILPSITPALALQGVPPRQRNVGGDTTTAPGIHGTRSPETSQAGGENLLEPDLRETKAGQDGPSDHRLDQAQRIRGKTEIQNGGAERSHTPNDARCLHDENRHQERVLPPASTPSTPEVPGDSMAGRDTSLHEPTLRPHNLSQGIFKNHGGSDEVPQGDGGEVGVLHRRHPHIWRDTEPVRQEHTSNSEDTAPARLRGQLEEMHTHTHTTDRVPGVHPRLSSDDGGSGRGENERGALPGTGRAQETNTVVPPTSESSRQGGSAPPGNPRSLAQDSLPGKAEGRHTAEERGELGRDHDPIPGKHAGPSVVPHDREPRGASQTATANMGGGDGCVRTGVGCDSHKQDTPVHVPVPRDVDGGGRESGQRERARAAGGQTDIRDVPRDQRHSSALENGQLDGPLGLHKMEVHLTRNEPGAQGAPGHDTTETHPVDSHTHSGQDKYSPGQAESLGGCERLPTASTNLQGGAEADPLGVDSGRDGQRQKQTPPPVLEPSERTGGGGSELLRAGPSTGDTLDKPPVQPGVQDIDAHKRTGGESAGGAPAVGDQGMVATRTGNDSGQTNPTATAGGHLPPRDTQKPEGSGETTVEGERAPHSGKPTGKEGTRPTAKGRKRSRTSIWSTCKKPRRVNPRNKKRVNAGRTAARRLREVAALARRAPRPHATAPKKQGGATGTKGASDADTEEPESIPIDQQPEGAGDSDEQEKIDLTETDGDGEGPQEQIQEDPEQVPEPKKKGEKAPKTPPYDDENSKIRDRLKKRERGEKVLDAPQTSGKLQGAKYKGKELPPAVIRLVEASLAKKTVSRYDNAWKDYQEWCREMQLSAETVDEVQIAHYLAEVASEKQLGENATRARCGAIKFNLELLTGVKFPESTLIHRVLQGIAKTKPAMSTHTAEEEEIWDFALVAEYFLKNHTNNSILTYNQLLGKAAILIEACGLRACDTARISFSGSKLLGFMGSTHNMNLKALTKETAQKKWTFSIVEGEKDSPLCPHCAVRELIRRRPKKSVNWLFVFDQTVHNKEKVGKAVTSDWVRNCVQKVMTAAGVDERFKPHSVRAAAASKAAELGVPFVQILKQFRWSPKANTFRKHYLKGARGNMGINVTLLARDQMKSGEVLRHDPLTDLEEEEPAQRTQTAKKKKRQEKGGTS